MLLDQYSAGQTGSFRSPIKTARKKNSHQNLMVSLISGMAVLFLFLSAFHSRNVLSQIEEKEIRVMKLKKSYQSLLAENEKLNILLTEIRQNSSASRILIKVMGEFEFKKQAENIVRQYDEKKQESEKKDYFGYFMILALILTALGRLLYLEFGKKETLPYPF